MKHVRQDETLQFWLSPFVATWLTATSSHALNTAPSPPLYSTGGWADTVLFVPKGDALGHGESKRAVQVPLREVKINGFIGWCFKRGAPDSLLCFGPKKKMQGNTKILKEMQGNKKMMEQKGPGQYNLNVNRKYLWFRITLLDLPLGSGCPKHDHWVVLAFWQVLS